MARKQGKDNKTPIMGIARQGFGLGLGISASLILFTLLGLLLFIPGFVLLNREQAKDKTEQNKNMKALAYVLMILGTILGMGFGGSTLLTELASEF